MNVEEYKRVISRALVKTSWKLTFIKIETKWFADEHWIFESVAQQYGLRIVVSPIFDPQLEGAPLAYIRAGTDVPSNWSDTRGLITQLWNSKGGFKNSLREFIKDINKYRNQVHEGTSKKEA